MKKELDFITPTELSRRIGISKQAVFYALNNGVLPYEMQNNRKKINLNDKAVIFYIKNETPQREAAKKKETPSKKLTKKKTKSNNPSDKNKKKSNKSGIPSDLKNLSLHELNLREKIAKMRQKEILVETLEKKRLPIEFIEVHFRYIEKLNSNLERGAAISIQEIGNSILEKGEVLPEHIQGFINFVLETTYNTVKLMKKEIAKYEPKI